MLELDNWFENKILKLKEELLLLIANVKKIHLEVLDGIIQKKYNNIDDILKQDLEINNAAEQIIQTAIWRLMQQRPFAGDLRKIIGYMEIVRQFVRISRYARNLARFNANFEPDDNIIALLKKLWDKNLKMINLLATMINQEKLEKITQMIALEAQINDLYLKAFQKINLEIKNINKTEDKKLMMYMYSIQQIKYLERLADNVINAAETLFYIFEGNFINLANE